MDGLSLSSSLSISKAPCHFLSHSNKPSTRFCVSCRATKVSSVEGNNNLYKILSLSPRSATMEDIKKAYRSKALRYHPDVCHDSSKKEEWTRMFVQLNAAYQTLSNPRLRAEYDYELGLMRSKESSVIDESWRSKWMEQLVELKRRSRMRMAQMDGSSGSWASRMRAQNMEHHH